MKKLTAIVFCLSAVTASLWGCGGGATTETSHTGTGGSGGSTSSTTSSSTGGQGGHGGAACTDPAKDCPDPGTSCIIATCSAGACGTVNAADGTPTSAQIPGDCKREVCDGAGATKVVDDDDPSDDGNDCTIDTCSAGTSVHTNADAGAACATNGGKVCGAGTKAGTCVECVADSDCTSGDVCDINNDNFVCVPVSCQDDVKNGSETSTDCGGPVCGPCGEGATCGVAADCTTNLCASGVCAACSADGDCLPGEFCNTTTGACTADQSGGSSCTGDAQCQSGHCADGVCCDTDCTGTCEACSAAKKGQGVDGKCGPIVLGSDPDDDCATEPASSCGKTGMCNGAGACALHAMGTVCTAPSCSGGVLQTADTCNGSGVCVDSGSTSCGSYQCNAAGTACLTSCSGDTDCANLSYCNAASQCVAKLTAGAACTGSSQCVTGNCVDGVCCNTACTGVCDACSTAKKGQGPDGVCGPIAAGSDPDDECATDATATCGKTGACNGAGACALYAMGTVCAAPSCSNGVLQNADACNGAGTCVDGGSTSCGAYQCNAAGTACLTSCAMDQDCAAGSYCSAGQCVAQIPISAACSSSNQCASGNCVDGFCCNTACTGTCSACSAAKKGQGTDGTCGAIKAGADPDNECAGSFSCNGAGACQSCSDGVKNGDEVAVDCGGSCAACGSTAATAGLSCLDLLQKGTSANGTYWIQPTGAAAAFQVYCDMTTAPGGWTALPLRFNDTAMWSITQAGSACVTISAKDNLGGFTQYFSSNTGTFADTIFKFVPQISVGAVRLVAFNHSPGGSCNSMDYAINAVEGSATSVESWWFSDTNAAVTRAFTFTSTACPAPYQSGGGWCTRDSNLGAGLFTLDRNLTYNTTAPLFQMVLRQGCQSSLCAPATDGERFIVSTPPDADGIWRNGIFVR